MTRPFGMSRPGDFTSGAPAKAGRGAYLTYRVLGAALQMLPQPGVKAVARLAGLVMTELSGREREVVQDNLRQVLGETVTEPELDAAVGEVFSSYAQYWIDGARLSTARPAGVLRRVIADGMEHVDEALSCGSGAIMVLPHLGSWEVGAYFLTLVGAPMTTVAEPIEPPELFEWFCSQREQLGLRVLPLSRETPGELMRALRAGRLVGLLADRDVGGTGVEVDFFGKKTTLPAGPAVLSLRTGAPLLPTGVFQEPGGMHRGLIREPIAFERSGRFRDDVAGLTQLVAHELETLIRRAPTQWHMLQPVWPADRHEPSGS